MASNFITQTYLENNFIRPSILLNGGFDHWQRGTSLNETELAAFSNYCADQWKLTIPVSQQVTIAKATDFVTSNARSSSCLSLALSNTTSSISSGSQYALFQPIEGIYARNLLYSPVTFAGKVKTNRAGIYSAFISWVDTATSNYYYCVAPITLLGTDTEESFSVTFPACPTTFTPQKGEAVSVKVGILLAGNATSVTGVYTTCSTSAETYTATGQVNFFASSSNTFKISQVTINPGSVAKVYFLDSLDRELVMLYRYAERLRLSSHLVNLYANTTSHVGNLSYHKKLGSTPTLVFQQTDESKTSITNSAAVYYVGGNTTFASSDVSTFARATRTTSRSTKFTFSTSSATPLGVDTGNINLDVLVISAL